MANEKGNRTKVQPIANLDDIKSIKNRLSSNPLNHALFVVGINVGLRASDLLNLKVWQVKDLKPDDDIEIVEKKTGKLRRITFNKSTINAIQQLLSSKPYDDMDYLFKGQRGVITVKGLNAKVKAWTKGLRGNYGTHSLRKSWGYHARVTFKVDWPTISECYGHSSQKQTMTYLCIQPEEIQNAYKNEL